MAVVELKVNRDFLDFKFEGYKLSLDSIPILKQPINAGVEHFEPNAEEYSYLQVHMSSHFNHLFQDSWCLSSVFFVSQKQFICWCNLTQDGRLSPIRRVWELPMDVHLLKGNSAIAFPSSEWAVVSSGNGTIYLLHTPSRPVGEPWILCHTYTLPECASSCYLLDSIHKSLLGRQQIDCLLAHFGKAPNSENIKSPPFNCHIEWLSFSCGQNIEDWNLKRTRRLTGSSALLYVALEKSFDSIYIASESEFQFVYDSEKPFISKVEETKDNVEEVPLYTYIQTPEDVTVVFRLAQKACKSDVQVLFQPCHIEVLWRGESVLKGQLAHSIDCTCSTWIVSEERLELILCKAEIGLMWQELIKEDKRGEELMDPALVEEIHSRLAHLTSEIEVTPSYSTPFDVNQLEECDSYSEVLTFIRIDGNSHELTHRVHLGGHQWLFSTVSCPKSLPVFCLRHDVDGVVWQPKNTTSEGEFDQFKIEHVATFSALGYVQASKQDKKFATCASDFSYAVISDCARHVYIYCRPESLHSALELRNRRTGECISHVAKQYVMNLENCYDILGLQVSNECIFVLSSNMLYAIKVCAK